MVDMGTAVFRAAADFSALDRAADKSAGKVKGIGEAAGGAQTKSTSFGDKFSTSMSKAGKSATDTGKKMTLGITVPAALIGTKAVQSFANFESAIVAAGSKSGATKDQIEAMKNVALDMGAKTKFSAGEAAVAMDNMAAAGFDANGVMQAIPGVMLAAQAAGEDLGLTADVTAKAINAFGLEAKDATHVADVFANAANTSALDMQGLGEALAHAGQLGATANQDLEDVVATLGRLVDQGVPAASAGAALRQAIQSLQAPSVKSKKLIANLGLEFRKADGTMKPLPDILKELETGLSASNPAFVAAAKASGKTATEFRDMAFSAMFGVEGSKAMALALSEGKPVIVDVAKETDKMNQITAGLTKTMGKDAAEAFVKAHTAGGKFTAKGADAVRVLGALGRASDGTAKKVGDIMSDTTTARMDALGGSLETLAIRMITAVAPALTDIVTKMTEMVNSFAGFAQAHPQLAKLAIGLLLVLAAAGPALIVIGKIALGVSALAGAAGFIGNTFRVIAGGGKALEGASKGANILGKAIVGIGKAFLIAGRFMLANPILLVIAGLALAAYLIYKNWDQVKAFLIAAWTAIKTVALAVFGAIVSFLSSVWGGVVAAWNAVWGAIRAVVGVVWAGIVAAVRTYIAILVAVVKTVVGAILGPWRVFWAVFGGLVTAVWKLIVAIVRLNSAIVMKVIQAVAAVIIKIWTTTWNTAVKVASAIWNAIVKLAKTVWNALKTAVVTIVTALARAISAVWSAIQRTASAAWNALKSAIGRIAGAIWGVVSGPVNTLARGLSAVWSAIQRAASAAFSTLSRIISGAISGIQGLWSRGWNALTGAVSTVMSRVQAIVQGAVDTIRRIIGGITGVIDSISGKVSALASKVGGLKLPFSKGGLVPGVGNKDSVDARLTPGEFVLTKSAVKRIGVPALQAMNRGAGGAELLMKRTQLQQQRLAVLKQKSVMEARRTLKMRQQQAMLRKVTAMEAQKVTALKAQQAAIKAAGITSVETGQGDGGGGGITNVFHVTVNNPVSETTAESLSKATTRLSALGVLD